MFVPESWSSSLVLEELLQASEAAARATVSVATAVILVAMRVEAVLVIAGLVVHLGVVELVEQLAVGGELGLHLLLRVVVRVLRVPGCGRKKCVLACE